MHQGLHLCHHSRLLHHLICLHHRLIQNWLLHHGLLWHRLLMSIGLLYHARHELLYLHYTLLLDGHRSLSHRWLLAHSLSSHRIIPHWISSRHRLFSSISPNFQIGKELLPYCFAQGALLEFKLDVHRAIHFIFVEYFNGCLYYLSLRNSFNLVSRIGYQVIFADFFKVPDNYFHWELVIYFKLKDFAVKVWIFPAFLVSSCALCLCSQCDLYKGTHFA